MGSRNMNILAAVVLLGLGGCSEEAKFAARDFAEAKSEAPQRYFARSKSDAGRLFGEEKTDRVAILDNVPGEAALASPEPQGGEKSKQTSDPAKLDATDATAISRKIIYNADVSIRVEDFDKTSKSISDLVKSTGGFLSSSNQTGSPGSMRTGTWIVRVPVEKFESFIEGLLKLGELESRNTTSDDVTRAFYDTESRMKNKQVEESRLVKLLQEETGKLKDVLDVERELNRVREEIEGMQSQLRQWASLSALSTVTIRVSEYRNYVPAANPSFGTRISRAFQGSIDALVDTVERWSIGFIAFLPWLPFWLIGALFAFLVLRMVIRRLAKVNWRSKFEIKPKQA